MDERRYSSWLLERLSLGEIIRLRIGITTIGRHPSNLIRITDSDYVSRNHAAIEVSEDDRTVMIADLKSVNGVSVNDDLHRQTRVPLKLGDKIGIGVIVDEEINNADPTHPVFVLRNVPLPRPNAANRARPCPLSLKPIFQKAPEKANDPPPPPPSQENQDPIKNTPAAAPPIYDCVLISDDDDDEHRSIQQTTSDGRNEKTSSAFGTATCTSSSNWNGELADGGKIKTEIITDEAATCSSVVPTRAPQENHDPIKNTSAAAPPIYECVLISDDDDDEHRSIQQTTSDGRNEKTSSSFGTATCTSSSNWNGELAGGGKIKTEIITDEAATCSSVVENATCSTVVPTRAPPQENQDPIKNTPAAAPPIYECVLISDDDDDEHRSIQQTTSDDRNEKTSSSFGTATCTSSSNWNGELADGGKINQKSTAIITDEAATCSSVVRDTNSNIELKEQKENNEHPLGVSNTSIPSSSMQSSSSKNNTDCYSKKKEDSSFIEVVDITKGEDQDYISYKQQTDSHTILKPIEQTPPSLPALKSNTFISENIKKSESIQSVETTTPQQTDAHPPPSNTDNNENATMPIIDCKKQKETNKNHENEPVASNTSIQSSSMEASSLKNNTYCDSKKKAESSFIEILDITTGGDQDYISYKQQTDSYAILKPIEQTLPSLSDLKASTLVSENINNSESIQSVATTTPQQTDAHPPSPNTDTAKAHMPIISTIKQERVRRISAAIQNIFGEPDEVIMDKLITINPYVYNNLNGVLSKEGDNRNLKSGDDINLLSEDECEKVDQVISVNPIRNITDSTEEDQSGKSEYPLDSKSPNLFESSLDDSTDVPKNLEDPIDLTKPKQSLNTDIVVALEEGTKLNNAGDDEEMMFSQVVINDMKAELAHGNIDDLVNDLEKVVDEMMLNNELSQDLVPMPITKTNLDSSCWSINDNIDDEYDAELENKVSDWSAKLFSQSFSQANMSQVYDDECNDDEECENSNDYEDDDCYQDFWTRNENDDEFLDELYVSLKEKCTSSDSEEAAAAIDTESKIETAKAAETEAAAIQTESNDSEIDLADIKPSKTNMAKIITDSSDEDNNESEIKDVKTKENHKKYLKVCLKDCIPKKKHTNNVPRVNSSSNVGIKIKQRRTSSSLGESINGNAHSRGSECRRNFVNQKPPAIKCPKKEENICDEIPGKGKHNSSITFPIEKSKSSRGPPEIIEAPQLPAHRGKLRGVSACPSTARKLDNIREKILIENMHSDLKKKWKQIPNIIKKQKKEHAKQIKETRKERLKELANKQREITGTSRKRKTSSSTEDNYDLSNIKKPKIKITTHNRGAFLMEDAVKPVNIKVQRVKTYKIPKKPKSDNSHSNDSATPTGTAPTSSSGSDHSSTSASKRSQVTERIPTFEETLSKCDLLPTKPKQQHATCNINVSSSSSELQHGAKPAVIPTESKSKAAARALRTTNKITFASMQRNFVESNENQKKLEFISQVHNQRLPCITDVAQRNKSVERKRKTVRFDDVPIIHIIERIYGATKKVDKKDLMPKSTINDRRQMIRTQYPMLDRTSQITSMFLTWSNDWLEKRNSDIHSALEVVLPMPAQFTSFENYKSVIFPLMKMEFLCVLEQGYMACKIKPFKVSLEYITDIDDRFMLITKYNISNNRFELPKFDLAILNFNDKHNDIFAYVSGNRRGSGNCGTLVFEILSKNYTQAYLNCIKEIDVRPVIDNMRIEFGAFNAVFQLESTPLFQKILNPLEILKSKVVVKEKIRYKGFDRLNNKQEQIVINTYAKIIDESTPNITLIKGPPGTGKSCVISNLALQTLYGEEVRCMDKKILICAQSNVAVDLIAAKLYDIQQRMRPDIRFRIIRYGMPDKIHPQVAPITLRYLLIQDQKKKLLQHNKNLADNKENLNNEIHLLEMQISDLHMRNIENTFEEEELFQKQKRLKILRSFVNQSIRPEDERSAYTWYLTNAHIVCTTLSSCVKLSEYVNYFDICMIDEATQCVEPWTLLPLKFGISSLVLVGDTQQLPATVLSKKAMDLGFGNSMFTRMQRCLESVHIQSMPLSSGIICSLQTQYRMNPEICKWPNLYFYKNELINANITQTFKTPIAPFSIINLAYSQNQHCSVGQISNNSEAEFVVKLVQALDGYIPHKYNSYGIITPYAQHRAQLETSLTACGLIGIMVNTIDSYQGIEKDVIIISNARTHGVGFLSNYQRLNVALTRPRKCLILCGNFKNLESVPSWRSLLANARERKIFHEISAESALDIHRNVIEKIKTKN